MSNPRGLIEKSIVILKLESQTSAASFIAITIGTEQAESRQLEEYLRYELEAYDEGFDQVYSDNNELPEDPLERTKLVIRFNFAGLNENKQARVLRNAEHRILFVILLHFTNTCMIT